MKSPVVRASVLLSCILAGVGLCAGAQPPDTDARVTPVVLAYRKARPAVVNISTTRLVRTRFSLFGGSDPFGDLLPDPFGRGMSVRSLGSGIVINPMGYIVTNAHVVRQAEEISVTFADDTRYEARVISSDPDMDLAVLKIDPPSGAEIHYLPLGRSDDLMVGETVIAIGNPLGLANTLTTGVLSAIDRDLKLSDDASISGLVQTDAPINPGNSGGPLLNIKGELIGINVAIRSDAQNIGFAIPVDKLAAEMVGLLDSERLNRTVLGVDVRPVHGGAGDEVVVTSVRKGTPADGKIDVGDVIVSLDGLPTPQISDYACAMVAAKAGQTLKIGLDRAGSRREVSVELAAKPKPDGKELAREHFGIVLREITPDLARDLRTRVKGLLVVEVEANGPAGQAGIEPGDVVFQVGRLHVTDVDTLGMVMEDIKPGQKMMIGIVRGNVSVSGYLTSRKKP